MARVAVYVYAGDPVSEAGVSAQLRLDGDLEVIDDLDAARVAVVTVDEVDDTTLNVLRGLERGGCERIVLVAARLDDAGLLAAVEAGVSAILRRHEAGPDQLRAAVVAADTGDGSIPPDLLGRLLAQVGRLQRNVLGPRGLTFSGLNEREVAVLRLVAEGLETAEIARTLSFSERTIKNVIHDVTSRLNLRNRSHAVAYAVREGLI